MQKGGTGEKIKVPGFRVAGKTGTAHKVDPATRRYSPNKYLSSFIGVVPADEPRLEILVMIDEASAGKYYGGAVAGPVFARIASQALKYLGVAGREPIAAPAAVAPGKAAEVAPEQPPLDVADLEDLPPAGPQEEIVVIPDFTGMSVGQALAAARAAGVQIEISGSGRAASQFPPPGRALKSITCRIAFDPG
jgi:cell division protein FtsI (penicillin-binding protein 3)